MGKIFKDKYCIYLDQFAISAIAEENLDNTWTKIKTLLEKGVQNNKCFVPYSYEHLLECSLSDHAKALKKDKLLFSLSEGKMIDVEPEINARLLISAVRNRAITANSFFTKGDHFGYQDEQVFKKFQHLKRIYNEMAKEGTGMLNLLRAASRHTGRSNRADSVESLRQNLQVYTNELITRLRAFHASGSFRPKHLKFTMGTIPFWADHILNILIRKYKLTKSEGQHAANILELRDLKTVIPPLYIRVVIETMMAIKHQQETVNDHVDVLRLCTGLPIADIILTDKARYFDLTYFNLDTDFNVKVYSGTKEHISRFSELLNNIID